MNIKRIYGVTPLMKASSESHLVTAFGGLQYRVSIDYRGVITTTKHLRDWSVMLRDWSVMLTSVCGAEYHSIRDVEGLIFDIQELICDAEGLICDIQKRISDAEGLIR